MNATDQAVNKKESEGEGHLTWLLLDASIDEIVDLPGWQIRQMEKKTSSANRLVLKRILGQPGNNKCADCKTATHPRWASWNIGILICIRCSGIHRSLGTHISKVRSIDLDTWNDQQLEKLVEFGNTKANAYWEAKLPPNYVPDESKIVNFIKTKYELKRWISDDDDTPLSTKAAPKIPPKVREPPTRSIDLLDLDGSYSVKSSTSKSSSFSDTPAASQRPARYADRSVAPTHAPQASKAAVPSLAAPKLSAGPPRQQQPATNAPLSSAPLTNSAQSARADVKKSILSLYSQQPRQPMSSSSPSVASSRAASTASLGPSSLSSKTSSTPSLSDDLLSGTPSRQPQPSSLAANAEEEEDNFANIWN